jgi:fluoroacetyl-CoA thioesterase
MKRIPVGARGSFTLLVQPEHLANRFKDAMLPPVFATPMMIMVMENAALNAIKSYLDPAESAVGTAINVRHLAATPVGRHVTGEAEVTKSTGGESNSRCARPKAARKSGPERIRGSSSTQRDLRSGSDKRRAAVATAGGGLDCGAGSRCIRNPLLLRQPMGANS